MLRRQSPSWLMSFLLLSLDLFWRPDFQSLMSQSQIYGIIASDSVNVHDVFKVPTYQNIDFVDCRQGDMDAVCTTCFSDDLVLYYPQCPNPKMKKPERTSGLSTTLSKKGCATATFVMPCAALGNS
jgi:hypothetical protein